jgi:hypothetical protein
VIWSLFVGALALLSIFIAYLRSQPRFQHLPTSTQPQPLRGYYGERAPTRASCSTISSLGAKGMYDRWLVARFSIAFVTMR